RQRVNQLIHRFLETETIPVNRRPGGALDEGTGNLVLQLHAVFDLDSVLPKKKIEDVVGTHILHTTIYRILLRNDLIEENMKENRQRKWVRASGITRCPSGRGGGKRLGLIAFMDDASRLITCYGTFDRPTTENAISVLEKGFKEYGIPDEILTDLGTQFVAPRNCEESRHTFKEYLPEKGIRHIVGGVRHLQMNGKIGRFFREGERRVQKFGSVE
ncbi:MAG: DDE-type integrase/transposase/recombinase, partial [Methanomicrobiales archaeon]|nr:DDE-type integrase/transposase/recombinase [Methanomicrobiales archaeon]